jgi:site-specific recombinase XerD
MQANRMLARNTIDSYSRSIEDFLRFVGRLGVLPESATREHVAEYLRDLLSRENPAQPKMVYIDSGAGFPMPPYSEDSLLLDCSTTF